MAFITIKSKGQEFICQFDARDQELINAHTWHLTNKGYVSTTIKGKTVSLHRIIMRVLSRPAVEIDHIDHNKRNNHRANLRRCSRSENRRNSRKFKGESQYKGIYREKGLWRVRIEKDGKRESLGYYRSQITAAKVYDEKARELFQSFAFTNFPGSTIETQLTIF